jgi:hypothetical protein
MGLPYLILILVSGTGGGPGATSSASLMRSSFQAKMASQPKTERGVSGEFQVRSGQAPAASVRAAASGLTRNGHKTGKR